MKPSPYVWARLSGVVALILGVFALLIGAQPATAQTGNSSIEVHNRECPEDYDGEDWFQDCNDIPLDPKHTFTVTNETSGETYTGTTNENGNVGFANLPAGTYTVSGGASGEFAESVVFCGPHRSDAVSPVDYVPGGIQIELGPNINLVCNWYTIPLSERQTPPPEPAERNSSIEVHHRVCPEDYDGGNWFQDCHGNVADPGRVFRFTGVTGGVTREGTTNENGNIDFANLPAHTYTILGHTQPRFNDYFVSCFTESTNEEIPVDYVTGGVQLDLPPNANVVCDWYTIPLSPLGTYDLPIYMLLCDDDPGGAASDFVMGGVMPEGCEQYGGATVTITALDGSPYGRCVTNANEPCYVTVDIGTTVRATILPTTLPEGYTVVGRESREIEVPPRSEAWVLFVVTPAPQPPPTQPSPVPLPVVGHAVAIHEGTCPPGDPGPIVVELPPLTGPGLPPDIEADVILAETSATTIDLTLDELMADEHALIAVSGERPPTPVACTAIEGQMNADGELVLGLQEVNDSGFAGIVYLVSTEDGTQSRISVFLAEGLADEDESATPTPVG